MPVPDTTCAPAKRPPAGRVTTAWAVPVVVCAGALGIGRAVRGFAGYNITGDALLYGELARNLAAGRGFVADFVYPISLAFPSLATLPQPHALYHPAYPSLLAPLFALFGPRDAVIFAANAAFACVLLLLTFLLARRVFGVETAVLATTLLALDTTVAANVRNSGTEVLAMVLVVVLATLLVEPPGVACAAVAGVILGVAWLTRPNLAVLVPLAALHLWRQEAARRLVPLLLGTLAAAAPWLARNWLLTGRPDFSLYVVANVAFDMPSFPGTMASYGELTPRGLGFMLDHHASELATKMATNVSYYARQLWFTVTPPVMALAVAAVVALPRAHRAPRLLVDFTALGVVVTVAGAVGFAREPRYLAPFAPLLVVLGVGWANRVVGALAPGPGRLALAALAAVLLALPMLRTAEDLARGAPPRWRDPNLAAVAALTTGDDVIVTDIGRGVTWYTGRRTLQAPIDRATLERIDREVLSVTAIYLSGRAEERWEAMFGRSGFAAEAYVPRAFVLVREFPDGARFYRRGRG